MVQIQNTSAVLFLVFGMLAFLDGFYLHLWRYRLFAWDSTRREHMLHSVRAVLFPAVIYLLLAIRASGLLLWLGAILALTDLVFQAWDLWEERRARQHLGGLSTFEYSLHVWLTGLHVSALALTLAARPLTDWALASLAPGAAFSTVTYEIAWFLLPGALLAGALHWVLLHPGFRKGSVPPAELNRAGLPALPPVF